MATYKVTSQGVEYTVTIVDKATGGSLVTIDGHEFDVKLSGGDMDVAIASRPAAAGWRPIAMASGAGASRRAASPAAPVEDGKIVAPISGTIISIHVAVGDFVSADQLVLKLEAMKMENEIASPIAGIVREISVSEGSDAATGQLLMTIG
jgi:biotin carboxyl carrier protein